MAKELIIKYNVENLTDKQIETLAKRIRKLLVANTDICARAIKTFGPEHQKIKAIEEMGELITALSREQDNRSRTEEIITEIADVIITVNQLAMIYGWKSVMDEVARKELRLQMRIENEFVP